MYSSKLELCRPRSKSCNPNCTHGLQSCYSSHESFSDRCDVKSSHSCVKLEGRSHTMEILEESVVNIDLPPLVWFDYNKTPKILSATNTGRTILINGQWACGRPYITGGPLNGSYIFSQIHFHSPSEHEIDGRRYPLEMHVVHYKSSYLTQERAMKEKDGTIVLVYLFQLIECGGTVVSHISKLASSLEKKNARRELSKIPLDQFVKPFSTNYYTYQSSVATDKSSYLLQWIISCNNLCVTREEIDELLFVINSSNSVNYLTTIQPENDVVFRVGEEDYCGWMAGSPVTDNPCCQKKVSSKTSVCKMDSKASLCKKCSKGSVCKKCSKRSICKKCSKRSICKKCSKGSVCKKCSKGSVCKKGSKGSVSEKRSKKSVRENSSKTLVSKKSSKKSVNKKCSKTTVNEKTSEKSVEKKFSKTSEDEKSSQTSVYEKSSKSSVQAKSSKTSLSEKSSEMSCASLKEKRDKSKSVKVCSDTNTTSSCSKSDIKEKQKAKKPKDIRVTKERSKSKSVKKCKDQGGTSEMSVKEATTSKIKEKAGEKKSKIRSAGSKSSKTKVKNSCGTEKKKSVEIHACTSAEKSDCSEANVKADEKCTEKAKIIYEKKGKTQVDPSTECSNTDEIIESANVCDDIEKYDDTCEDVQISYLMMPNTSSSVPSNTGNTELNVTELKNKKSLTKTGDTTTESKNFIKLPSHSIISHALVNAIKFPVVKSEQTKNLCLHTKHIFRTEGNNKEFTPHSFQECHILIERDHNVLQEYNGTLYPSKLSLGNYEQLNLSPRYSDPDDLKIHATECIAKLESLHELSIRAKFIISETNFNRQKSETFLAYKRSKDSIEKMKSSFDAQCQCEQPASTSVALDTKFLEEEANSPCKSLIKWDLRNMGLESLDLKNTEIVNMQQLNLRAGNEVDSRTRHEEKNSKKALVEQNGTFKLMRSHNNSRSVLETTLNSLLEHKYEREVDKAIDHKISIKSIKNSFDKHKKTTYFVYDRIEKDENSEVKVLYKPEYFLQNDRMSSNVLETQSNNNQTFVSGNRSHENVLEKFRDSQVNKESASKEKDIFKKSESKEMDHKKEVITLHKFEPKHNNLRAARKKSKSHIVGKISSKVDTESEKYSQLVNMIGVDKTRIPKISFYEFQESDAQNVSNASSENSSKFEVITLKAVENFKEVDKNKVFPSTSDRSDFLDGESSDGLEGTSSLKKRPQDSEAAVVLLPIEVNNLSNVEIVLIEHTDDVKKQKVENKYISYLKHYKRLILKLKSSFL